MYEFHYYGSGKEKQHNSAFVSIPLAETVQNAVWLKQNYAAPAPQHCNIICLQKTVVGINLSTLSYGKVYKKLLIHIVTPMDSFGSSIRINSVISLCDRGFPPKEMDA
jgi:hypothetical protein